MNVCRIFPDGTVMHLQMILVWEHTFYHHDNSPFSIIHAINEKPALGITGSGFSAQF